MPRMHPVTGLPLEDGFGALPDDLQAERIHIPYIRQWRGEAAAEAMLAKLKAEEAGQAPTEPPPEPQPEPVIEAEPPAPEPAADALATAIHPVEDAEPAHEVP